ncbi:MAG: hypothetical protein L0Y55_18310 [Anaerolineales bacterium]|nr:hypothetical protein [Anaerolineales bacterium]
MRVRASPGRQRTLLIFQGRFSFLGTPDLLIQKFVASAGLMYYGTRYYDAQLGRFINADTIVPSAANPQALNRYAYALNNPLRYTDSSGRFPWSMVIGFASNMLSDYKTVFGIVVE